MRLRNEVKVGMIVTAGIAILIAVYWFLGGLGVRASTYPLYAIFPNVQRLDKGAMIRMAGVKIGIVLDTGLTRNNRAKVNLLIDNGISIAKDSVARVTTGGFIGEYYVDVSPGKSRHHLKSGDEIRTETFAQPDEILQQVGDILGSLKKSTQGVTDLLGDKDMVDTIRATVKELRDSAEQASQLAAAMRGVIQGAAPEIAQVLANLSDATAGAGRISEQLEKMVANDIRPGIKGTIGQAEKTLTQAAKTIETLDSAIQQAQGLMGSFKGTTGKLDTALGAVGDTAVEAKEMMSNLKDASAGVKSLATDQQMQQDIKNAVRNAAMATEQLKELTEALNKKYGQTKSTPYQHSRVPDNGFTTNSLWNTDQGSYRFDANYAFPYGQDTFARVGAWNIGENTRLNLQGGSMFGGTSVRYGLYASRVGFGFDQKIGRAMLISGDVFRPNDPQMEIRGVLKLKGPMGIYSGVYDLFHESNRDVYVGLHYQK
jgi:phospholipid/cholesterol/gamma-HCH transport system substrate-binding protein